MVSLFVLLTVLRLAISISSPTPQTFIFTLGASSVLPPPGQQQPNISGPVYFSPVPTPGNDTKYAFFRTPLKKHRRLKAQHISARKYYIPIEPVCVNNNTKAWCLEDPEYPAKEIGRAVEEHYQNLVPLYADLVDLKAEFPDEGPDAKRTLLCSSKVTYIRPRRVRNANGKWRVIVNDVVVGYENLTQTYRVEECVTSGEVCPHLPSCYESKCLQKFAYHRILVYDAEDKYFPFAIETFKLPTNCACFLGSSSIDY